MAKKIDWKCLKNNGDVSAEYEKRVQRQPYFFLVNSEPEGMKIERKSSKRALIPSPPPKWVRFKGQNPVILADDKYIQLLQTKKRFHMPTNLEPEELYFL